MTMKNDTKFEEELTFQLNTWGISQILTSALKNLKNVHFIGCFWPKYIILSLKINRGVMFDGTEDWWKIWKKTELCFLKMFVEKGWRIAISF